MTLQSGRQIACSRIPWISRIGGLAVGTFRMRRGEFVVAAVGLMHEPGSERLDQSLGKCVGSAATVATTASNTQACGWEGANQ